jgi:hypothetical protein
MWPVYCNISTKQPLKYLPDAFPRSHSIFQSKQRKPRQQTPLNPTRKGCMMNDSYQHLPLINLGPLIDRSTKTERRKYPRFKMNKNVLTINDDVLAEVMDISRSGISFQCPAIVGQTTYKFEKVSLFNCRSGASVDELTCRLVRSSNKVFAETLPAKMITNCSLEFGRLSKIKRKQLFQFIKESRQA